VEGGGGGGQAGSAGGGISGGASGGLAGGAAGGVSGGLAGGAAGGASGGLAGGASGGVAGGASGGLAGGAAGGASDTFWVRTGGQVLRQRPPGSTSMLVSAMGQVTKDFAVSPDGTLVAFVYDAAPETLAIVSSAGGPERVIYTALSGESLSFATISPDNQWVAFVKSGVGFDLFVVSTSPPHLSFRATPTRLPMSSLGPSRWAFSPNSRALAIIGDLTTDGTNELHVFDLMLRTNTTLVSSSQAASGGGPRELGWTNAGKVITRATLGSATTPVSQIYTCEVSGTCAPLPGDPGNGVTSVSTMAVSPDGTLIVYSGNQRTGFSDLYRISSLGGLSTRILQSPASTARVGVGSIVISPNNQSVAFLGDFTNMSSLFDLYVIPATGVAVVQALVGATGTQAIDTLRFSPGSTSLAFRMRTSSSGPYAAYQTRSFAMAPQSPLLLQAAPVNDLSW
jgi:Tol biopolymer transport system component